MEKMTKEDNFDLLKKYGYGWAALTAMCLELEQNKILVPKEVKNNLEKVRVEIRSGCYSACEIGCILSDVEGKLIACGTSKGDNDPNKWTDLFAQAMSGDLEPGHIASIPALQPVIASCDFLKCTCQI
ncbi:MAG: hypothetical protein ABII18_05130 [bacterium]|nr:hypothetical protein [bacterium]MBU1918807.1 hypothetical protein [bacterium]